MKCISTLYVSHRQAYSPELSDEAYEILRASQSNLKAAQLVRTGIIIELYSFIKNSVTNIGKQKIASLEREVKIQRNSHEKHAVCRVIALQEIL